MHFTNVKIRGRIRDDRIYDVYITPLSEVAEEWGMVDTHGFEKDTTIPCKTQSKDYNIIILEVNDLYEEQWHKNSDSIKS